MGIFNCPDFWFMLLCSFEETPHPNCVVIYLNSDMVEETFTCSSPFMTVEVGMFRRPALTMGEAKTSGDIRKRGNNVVARDSPLSKWPGPREKGIW